ncbi:MAG: helix-turn-helix domain-containing protein [Clostridia bacterium]|nr:helix-turn-helix domain-containing protein [Clostridia bacterium]
MDFTRLNPVVRSAGIFESVGCGEERIAYDARIIYVVSGDLTASVGSEKLGHLGPGHMLYIPSGVPYKLRGQYFRVAALSFDLTGESPEPSERMAPVATALFDPSLLHPTAEHAPFDKYIHLPDMESEREGLLEMCDVFTSAVGEYRARVSAMLKLLLIKLAELADENALPARMIEALDAYIRENVGEEISNTEIGAIFGYHPFYVSRVLKESRGQTLRQYIISYRLGLAKNMLRYTAKSVGEIAEECGFTDASYFTKTFKSALGVTPKEYRNSFKDDFI